jgi:hypothetical protein
MGAGRGSETRAHGPAFFASAAGYNMGNFYTNVTLRTSERAAVVEHMRAHRRDCFISPNRKGFTTVYDRLCEDQDIHNLEALATDLSAQFRCTALAVLNHDDSILWVGLIRDGVWITKYNSSERFSGSAFKIAREFGVLGLAPLVSFLMRCPMLFQIMRHAAIAATIGIPKFSVGFGYEYLLRGERPDGVSADEFEVV